MADILNQLRASYDTHHVGASLAKGEITVWKTQTLEKITTVRPGFECGAGRYAIDPVNRLIFSGTWGDGLTCFDYEGGKPEWHRDDLIGIQRVDISSAFPSSVFVALEGPDYRLNEPGIMSGIVELDSATGKTVWMTQDADEVYLHPTMPIILFVDRRKREIRILDEERRLMGSTLMANFAVLDVAFNDDMIALAEGEKGVRTIRFDGKTIVKHLPATRRPNCTDVAFSLGNLSVHDSWEGSFVTLINSSSGNIVSEYRLHSHTDICFIDEGSRFVDRDGRVFRSADGESVARLQ